MKGAYKQELQRPNFRKILRSVASQNAAQLMGRARLANALAKSLRGQARARAYAVKAQALLDFKLRFPERVRIVNDPHTPRFVLVKASRPRFGLHAPAALFERSQVKEQRPVR